MSDHLIDESTEGRDIAIIGMAGRFPGAPNLDLFWQNLRDGREAVTFFSDEELIAAGVPATALSDPQYVKAGTVLENIDCFDAAFFGYTPREAELMDPQQRVFLECAWHALEHAGYVPDSYDGVIGIYAGVAWNTYLLSNLISHPELFESASAFQTFITNDKDFMPTRVSYKLNLKGPSMVVATSCSTSLVATHMACQSLLDFDCDIALVGGVSIRVPHQAGYFYHEDGIASPDGHCRAFDASAQGTIFGSGVGVVALKRLDEAIEDGDTIHAVIKGSAINNDGALKVSYTAPGVDGQVGVIATAQSIAQVSADSIGYVEAHGTGTALGDPIEVAALTKVFQASTARKGFCALGSVKTNIGHLDAAAGVAGLIKTVLALKHAQIPPTLHYQSPNPKIDFVSSPFYVNTTLRPWPRGDAPRRAGVSSFGVGGTNAHLVLEEAPRPAPRPAAASAWQLLPLSARSASALDRLTAALAAQLQQQPDLDLADVAYTLQTGRKAFAHRRFVLCQDRQQALAALEGSEPQNLLSGVIQAENAAVGFLFPGQGTQYVGMGRGLYETEPVFRDTVDRCCALLLPHLGLDLRRVLFPPPAEHAAATAQLTATALAQPALFVIAYATAQLWQHWGLRPAALLGHSLGEFVAATLAGVFTLDDALALVAARGRLMQQTSPGVMLSVSAAAAAITPHLSATLSLAASNSPRHCVISGPPEAISGLEAMLAEQGLSTRRLTTSHAFHSALMEPVQDAFAAALTRVQLSPPTLPVVSNVTGTWLSAADATDPQYWTRQLRAPVQFDTGVQTILAKAETLLEVGPGNTLGSLVRAQPVAPSTVASLPHPNDQQAADASMLVAFGKLWLAGVALDWTQLHADQQRRRVPLPGYDFDRTRYWIAPRAAAAVPARPSTTIARQPDPSDWFYLPCWKRTLTPGPVPPAQLADTRSEWLLFIDERGLGAALATHLRESSQGVTLVQPGPAFKQIGDAAYTINPRQPDDYTALIAALHERQRMPGHVLHLWTVTSEQLPMAAPFDELQMLGCHSILALVQALVRQPAADPIRVEIISNHMQSIGQEATLHPAKATLLGPCLVATQEHPHIVCRSIDVAVSAEPPHLAAPIVAQLLAEFVASPSEKVLAYRANQRWVRGFEPVRLADRAEPHPRLRPHGIYLITGGLVGAGFELASYLAQAVQARLILLEPDTLLPRERSERELIGDTSDELTAQMARVRTLEQHGASVSIVSVRLQDAADVTAAVAEIQARYGPINGVIHAAGLDRTQILGAVEQASVDQAQAHFAPKVHGLLALDQALAQVDLDFGLVISSLATVLGGRGTALYAASNLFLDSFAQAAAQTRPGRWLSVNLDAWAFADENEQIAPLSAELSQLAIQPDEGGALIRRILELQMVDQIVVSTVELSGRLARLSQSSAHHARREHSLGSQPRHARPELATAFVGPSSELEQRIVEIWQQALGFERIGIHDNFFELGGDSFIAVQVAAQLKSVLGVAIPAVKLYQSLTIKTLAELLNQDSSELAQRRSNQLEERKEQMSRRKQYQEMRRTRR